MHGVQPAAKAMPRGKAPAAPGFTRARNGRRSAYRAGHLTRSAYRIITRPNRTTMPPETLVPVSDLSSGSMTHVNAPSSVNTSAKPKMNMRTGNVERSSRSCPPVTSARYPGTSGQTHGEANETTPAAKARAGAHHDVNPELTTSANTSAPPPPSSYNLRRNVVQGGTSPR